MFSNFWFPNDFVCYAYLCKRPAQTYMIESTMKQYKCKLFKLNAKEILKSQNRLDLKQYVFPYVK